MSNDVQDDWKTVEFGGRFSLSLPAEVEAIETQGVDTQVFRWQGPSLEVVADLGLFGDPLLSGPEVSVAEVGGLEARRRSHDTEDGGCRLAIHLPEVDSGSAERRKLTISVTASSQEGRDAAERILESLRIDNP